MQRLNYCSAARAMQRVCNTMATLMAWVTLHGRQKCRLWKAVGIWIHRWTLSQPALRWRQQREVGISRFSDSFSVIEWVTFLILTILQHLLFGQLKCKNISNLICSAQSKGRSCESFNAIDARRSFCSVFLWISKLFVQYRVKLHWKWNVTDVNTSTWVYLTFLVTLFSLCLYSYRYPTVAALAPSQSVVVVGQMAVWVVPHKPGSVGHLLMEINETEIWMRNDIKEEERAGGNPRQKKSQWKKLGKCKIKKLAFMLRL